MFNLFRGSGASGLGAMRPRIPPQNRRTAPAHPPPSCSISGAAKSRHTSQSHRLKFREDTTNGSGTIPLRNRMRHEIIPALEKWFGREIRKSVRRTADILAEENNWLESLTASPSSELSVAALRKMPVAQQRNIIHAWLKLMSVNQLRLRRGGIRLVSRAHLRKSGENQSPRRFARAQKNRGGFSCKGIPFPLLENTNSRCRPLTIEAAHNSV